MNKEKAGIALLVAVLVLNLRNSLTNYQLDRVTITRFYYEQTTHTYTDPGKQVTSQIYRISRPEMVTDSSLLPNGQKIIRRKHVIQYNKVIR